MDLQRRRPPSTRGCPCPANLNASTRLQGRGIPNPSGHDVTYLALEEAATQGRKPQQGIRKRFQAARRMLAQDPLWGDVIKASAIPAYFREKYGVRNLFCIDLKGDVRCFYPIDERDVIFLDIVDHDQYDKWFPPKGRKARR